MYKKRQGEWPSWRLCARRPALGLEVAKPYGETERFDFIVTSGTTPRKVAYDADGATSQATKTAPPRPHLEKRVMWGTRRRG